MTDKCEPTKHNFTPQRSGYYKEDGGRSELGTTYNQSVSYTMLYCTQCGETKEVICQDHRKG